MKEDKVVTVTLNPAIDETVLIGNFGAGKVNRVDKNEQNAGGKGINVAAAVSDYGISVCATGFLGKTNDAIFSQMFSQKGIVDHCIRIDGRTRIGIKISDPVNNTTTDINYPGLLPNDAQIQKLLMAIETLALDNEWFVLAGSVPKGMSSKIYGEIITLLKHKDKKVILDTSGEAFSYAVKKIPYVIKPNIEELSEYTGHKLTTIAEIFTVATEFVENGIYLVIVSMGKKGALFVTKKDSILAIPPKVEDLITTVGAGDAMISGTLCGLIHQLDTEDIARLATAFSVTAVRNIRPGIPNKEILKDIAIQVQIENKKIT